MSKKPEKKKEPEKKESNKNAYAKEKDSGYLWSMSHAPRIDEGLSIFQLLPIILFSAVVVMIVRAAVLKRSMEQFYWTGQGNDITDFFSYNKMILILICAAAALVFLLFRLVTQALAVKRTSIYIPMLIFTALVILSYIFSDYKEFSLLGYNDRFEGTLVLLAYMIMLFYTINSINTEKAVKQILYPLAASSVLLSLLGLSQALDHDFFRTALGKTLIVPAEFAKMRETLSFTFENKEIYQTVYNINYVSFYLTLLIPLFGLIFIRSVMRGKAEALWKKILWGLLFALLIFNLIGSASSGGFLGMGVVVLFALVLLNKKILEWWKPLVVLLAITIIVGGITYDRWAPELGNTFKQAKQDSTEEMRATPGNPATKAAADRPHIDYFDYKSVPNTIAIGLNGNALNFAFQLDAWPEVQVSDAEGNEIELEATTEAGNFQISDSRFSMCSITTLQDTSGNKGFMINTGDRDWLFVIEEDRIIYLNDVRKPMELIAAKAIGWENNLDFGSGRGYIWSRSLPLIKDTFFIGHGADTFCLYFPHNDYVGKYNAGWPNPHLIVDKPHNMYIHMAVGTGLISVLAFLAILLLYAVQSVRIFWRRKMDGFLDFAGVGIFLGIVGFAVTGFVDDSTVSVMPMFYGLLGTGIAINIMLRRAS